MHIEYDFFYSVWIVKLLLKLFIDELSHFLNIEHVNKYNSFLLSDFTVKDKWVNDLMMIKCNSKIMNHNLRLCKNLTNDYVKVLIQLSLMILKEQKRRICMMIFKKRSISNKK